MPTILTMPRAALAAIAFSAVPVAAQETCRGPGAAFGVETYQCGDCSMRQKPNEPEVWSFRLEPQVVRAAAGSLLRGGDIIVALNGRPITTAGGAELFTHPPRGEVVVAVRRGGTRADLRVQVDCAPTPAPPSPAGVAAGRGRFGFAIECSRCTLQMREDGIGYWAFSEPPVIADVDPDGPAGRAGLRSGDVIVAVDGHPVMDPAGSEALARSVRARSLRLMVHREGRAEITVDLSPRSSEPDSDGARRGGQDGA